MHEPCLAGEDHRRHSVLAMDAESGAALVGEARYDIITVNRFLSQATFDGIVTAADELGMSIVAQCQPGVASICDHPSGGQP